MSSIHQVHELAHPPATRSRAGVQERRRRALAPLALLAAALGACGGTGSPDERPNILLITVDTLRRDHLSAYGYERPTSPALERLAAESVVFEDAQAQAPWTLPSLATLLTGLPTSAHGCRSFHDALAPSYATLAEALLAQGYDTAAVTSHVFLGRPYGLHQGFVHFDDELVLEMTRSDEVISSPAVSDKAIAFLQAKAALAEADGEAGPWFLWLHYFDPHAVYQRHPGISKQFGVRRPVDLYDGEIAFTDLHIGRVLEALDAGPLGERTIVALTADHGEEFGDHGGLSHGHTLYREQLDVPLLLRAPGLAPDLVTRTVRTQDLAPTLLELAGMPAFEESLGRSLVPLFDGGELELGPSLAELERSARLSQVALVNERYKLIHDRATGTRTLFDRHADPTELSPLGDSADAAIAALEAELEAALARARAIAERHPDAFQLDLGAAELSDLAGTGYVGDAATPEEHDE